MIEDYVFREHESVITILVKRNTLCFPDIEITREILKPLLAKEPSCLLIDLSLTHHLDSGIIGFLIQLGRDLNQKDSALVLINPHQKIRDLLEHMQEDAFSIDITLEPIAIPTS